ncbi:MAG: YciI family protein [Allorhizobium sp.]
MRVMVMVKATDDSEAGLMPEVEMFEAMGKFNEELVNAGIMLAGEGLKPTSKAKRVSFDGTSRRVIDGPFTETRELVAGYWIWEVKDMDEAVEWVKRCPNPMPGPSDIDIRPVYEMADFAEFLTPEVAELHEQNEKKLTQRESKDE